MSEEIGSWGIVTFTSLSETASASTSPKRRLSDADLNGAYRRRSEGSEPASVNIDPTLPTPVLLRCRYSRCGKTALPSSKEAKSYKNCHNCSYTYCSRACRRSHWERHRKTCLFSRMGTLCRQVSNFIFLVAELLKKSSALVWNLTFVVLNNDHKTERLKRKMSRSCSINGQNSSKTLS